MRAATGILTVDLDAIVANWRKLEKTAVPAECAGRGQGGRLWLRRRTGGARAGATPAARRFSSPPSMRRAWSAPRCRRPTIYVLDGFFQNTGDAYAKIDCRPVIGDLNELAEWDVFCRRSGWAGGAAIHIDTGMNRLGLTVRKRRASFRASMPAITASRW